jgi:hypothetical protein
VDSAPSVAHHDAPLHRRTRRSAPAAAAALAEFQTGTPAANDPTRDAHAHQYTRLLASPQRCAARRERAATRGRSTMEGGDEHAGAKGVSSFECQPH